MRLFKTLTIRLLITVLAILGTRSAADEYLVTVQKIQNGSVTFVPRNEGMRGKGKGGKKGGVTSRTLPVADDVQVTTATHTRRTGAFHIGTPVGGGLKNSAVRQLEPGTLARIVTDGKRIIELNLVLDDGDGTIVVAVPPKPAPQK